MTKPSKCSVGMWEPMWKKVVRASSMRVRWKVDGKIALEIWQSTGTVRRAIQEQLNG